MLECIHWSGHSSFFIDSTLKIYINPWRIAQPSTPADLILISHYDYNTCSPADIDKIRTDDTQIITTAQIAAEIAGCMVLRPWQSVTVGRAGIKAVPAYDPDASFDAEERLGFVISLNYYDIYFAGNTQIIPEMRRIQPDIAILPVGGDGAMTASDAARAATELRPRWAIPCNWSYRTGGVTQLDAQRFAEETGTQTEVVLLPPVA